MIIIFGAPGTGKQDFATKLQEEEKLGASSGVFPGIDVALGLAADYRTELYLASNRALWMGQPNQPPGIYWHSLLDNMAYSTLNLALLMKEDGVPEFLFDRWGLVVATVGRLFEDSWKAEKIYFLDKESDDEDEILYLDAWREVLSVTDLEYETINVDEF